MPVSENPTNDKVMAWVAAGVMGIFLLIGGIAFAVGWHQVGQSNAAASWPSTDATIITSRVVSRQVRDRRDYSWHTVTQPEIVFRYEVDGRAYDGTKLDPTGFMSSGGADVVARYPLGTHVRAYYDPRNPADAALTNAATGVGRYVFLAIGTLMMLLGTPFGYLAIRWWRRGRARSG